MSQASGNDGHVPANVLDNNLNTRWSNRGIGSFIHVDLGTQKIIWSVDIAWYRGNVRENNFVISVSNDSSGFAPVGKSSGSTLSAENILFNHKYYSTFCKSYSLWKYRE